MAEVDNQMNEKDVQKIVDALKRVSDEVACLTFVILVAALFIWVKL